MRGRPSHDDMAEQARELGGPSAGQGALTAEEFAARLQEAAQVLWTVAAGVLGARDEAEDVLQEAALMALGKLDHFERGTNFVGWMATFVRNVALNHGRKRQRRRTEAVAPERAGELLDHARPDAGREVPCPVDGAGGLRAGQEHFDDRVLGALGELADVPRAALLLRTVLGQSYREIAGVLGVPEGTAMSHVHRARGILRRALGGDRAGAGADASPTAARPIATRPVDASKDASSTNGRRTPGGLA